MQQQPPAPDEQPPAEPEGEQQPSLHDRITGALGAEGEPETPPVGEQQPPAQPEMIEVDGVKLTREEFQALVQFRDWARANPERVSAMNDYIADRARIVPIEQPAPGTPPAPPEQPPPGTPPLTPEELEDLPEPVRARLQRFDELEQTVTGLQQQVTTDEAIRHQAAIEQASTEFQKRYGLSTEQLENLSVEVARAGVLRQFVGLAGGNVNRGTQDAMEAIYFRDPANRLRELERLQAANKTARERQRNASRLAGSGGSLPRTPEPAKMDPGERRRAMTSAIAEALRGGTPE